MKKIFILGSSSQFGMERSYQKALEHIGFEVEIIDFNNLINSYFPIKFFKRSGSYFDYSPAIIKANHFISKKLFAECPYAVIVFTHIKIFPGTIEYFKIFCKNVVYYWPDSIVNMTNNIYSNLKHYTHIYTHSDENVKIFQSTGVKSSWLPFAGETLLTNSFNPNKKVKKEFDFSFIGAFRPERFQAINELLKNFPECKILLVGLGWKNAAFFNKNNVNILNRMVNLNEFLNLTATSKIALNAIDHLNYPSSNLRFFEIALSNVPQISTHVPEFDQKFEDEKHVFYYKDMEELIMKAKYIFSNYDEAVTAATAFRQSIDLEHNYIARAERLRNNFI